MAMDRKSLRQMDLVAMDLLFLAKDWLIAAVVGLAAIGQALPVEKNQNCCKPPVFQIAED